MSHSEKNLLVKNKGMDQLHNSVFVFHFLDGISIFLNLKFLSIFFGRTACLCRTWSETQKMDAPMFSVTEASFIKFTCAHTILDISVFLCNWCVSGELFLLYCGRHISTGQIYHCLDKVSAILTTLLYCVIVSFRWFLQTETWRYRKTLLFGLIGPSNQCRP